MYATALEISGAAEQMEGVNETISRRIARRQVGRNLVYHRRKYAARRRRAGRAGVERQCGTGAPSKVILEEHADRFQMDFRLRK